MREFRDSDLLAGLTVVDFGRLLPSGVATYQLAALGANVIKVERPPLGDHLRVNPPLVAGRGDMHLHVNRNKRSIALDFASDVGREVAQRLVRRSDVVVESSRPGAFARYGLDFRSAQRLQPTVVYCSFTGYGQTGPYAALPAHGLSADAAAGMLTVTATDGPGELPDGFTSAGAWAAGMQGAVAIVAALVRSPRVGRHIDVSQSDAALAFNFRDVTLAANPHELGDGSFARLGPHYAPYRCRDGHWLLLTVTETKLWNEFCTAVDRTDLRVTSESSVLPYGADPVLAAELATVFASRDRTAWMSLAVVHGLGLVPIQTPATVRDDPHFHARDSMQTVAHPLGGNVDLVGFPVSVDGRKPAGSPAPELGEHSEQVLAEAGFGAAEIAALFDAGTVR